MKLKEQAIESYMTKTPHSIEPHQSIASARVRMRELAVHHLPVCSGGKVYGVISDKDLAFLEGLQNKSPSKHFQVLDAMGFEPCTVQATTKLGDVVQRMLKNRDSCAVVVDDDNKLIGIFTYTDALQLLTRH